MIIQPAQTDVVVIGGGSAGLCAALGSARNGSNTILLERSDRLGGMGTLAMVHTFCGLYHPDTSKPPQIANPGLPQEIEALLRKRSKQDQPVLMGKVYVLPQHPELYSDLTKELTEKEQLLKTRYFSTCTAIEKNTNGSFNVSVLNNGQKYTITCQSIVDTSGDAIAADILGATRHCAESKRLQRPAYIFALQNVTAEAGSQQFRMKLALDLVKAVKAETLPQEVLGAAIRPSIREKEIFITIDLDTKESTWNPNDSAALQEIETLGQNLATRLTQFLRDRYSAFKNSSSPILPQQAGIRESFRWLGQYILNEKDLLESSEFNDTVAYATWPLELRETTKGPKLRFFKKTEPSAIPLSALKSSEIPGVYFAGRCLSATHEALASLRVMGTCFATGQAAGIAASLHTKGVTDTNEQANRIQHLLYSTTR